MIQETENYSIISNEQRQFISSFFINYKQKAEELSISEDEVVGIVASESLSVLQTLYLLRELSQQEDSQQSSVIEIIFLAKGLLNEEQSLFDNQQMLNTLSQFKRSLLDYSLLLNLNEKIYKLIEVLKVQTQKKKYISYLSEADLKQFDSIIQIEGKRKYIKKNTPKKQEESTQLQLYDYTYKCDHADQGKDTYIKIKTQQHLNLQYLQNSNQAINDQLFLDFQENIEKTSSHEENYDRSTDISSPKESIQDLDQSFLYIQTETNKDYNQAVIQITKTMKKNKRLEREVAFLNEFQLKIKRPRDYKKERESVRKQKKIQ